MQHLKNHNKEFFESIMHPIVIYAISERPTAAIMYDFDKTLCTKDTQEYTFIPNVGMTAESFREVFACEFLYDEYEVACWPKSPSTAMKSLGRCGPPHGQPRQFHRARRLPRGQRARQHRQDHPSENAPRRRSGGPLCRANEGPLETAEGSKTTGYFRYRAQNKTCQSTQSG